MKHLYVMVIACLCALYGCAGTPEPQPMQDTEFYLARYDNVWETTLEALRHESIPVGSMDREKGLITTTFVNYSAGPQAHHGVESIARRPYDPRMAIWSQVVYKLTIHITPITDMSTKVRITARIEAYDKNVTREWHECLSLGVIENEFLGKIRARL